MSSFSNAIEAGRAFLKVVIDDADIAKGFERIQTKLNVLGQRMQKWGAISSAVSGVIVGSIGAAAKSFAQAGAAIDDMSKRTGFTAKALGELSYAAEQSGANLAGLEKSVKGMEKFLYGASRGGAGFTATLDEIGVSLADIQDQSPERQFEALSEAIAGVEDPSRRAALAMKIFGKSGADLLPMLMEGKGGIAALRDEAHRLGLVMSEQDVEAAAKLDDAIARLGAQATMAFNAIGGAVAGPLTDFGDKISVVLADVIAFVRSHPDMVAAIAAIGTAAVAATASVAALGTALTVATAHPIILAITAVGLAVAGIYIYFDEITAKTNEWRWALEKIAPPGGILDLLLKLTKIRQLQIDIAKGEQDSPMFEGKGEKDPPMFVGEDGKMVGGLNGKFSNGQTIGPSVGKFANGRNLDSPIPDESVPFVNSPAIDPLQRSLARLGLNRHEMNDGKGGAKLKKRLEGWASAAANAANLMNPLAGVDVGGMAGDATRFGKKALAGKVDWQELGDDAMQGVGNAWQGFNEFLFGKHDVASMGTFNANAVASLQGGNLDQQSLNALLKLVSVTERMERKGDGWGAT